jgi:hypothetical protein
MIFSWLSSPQGVLAKLWHASKGQLCALIAAGCLAYSVPAVGQQTTIEWDSETCHYSAMFDSTKHDEVRVRNTSGILYPETGWIPYFDVFPGSLMDMRTVPRKNPSYIASINQYTRECAAAIDNESKIALLDLPGLAESHARQLKGTKELCDFNAVQARAAAGNAAALREFAPAATSCGRYIDALESTSDIRPLWRDVVKSSCMNNGEPLVCEARASSEASGADGAERMRLYVLQYGWTNCAAGRLKVNTMPARLPDEAFEDLARRLNIVKSDCHPEAYD